MQLPGMIPDYPGVQGNQVGFNFKYEAKNIDVAEVEKVKIEFNVPNDITIEKPEIHWRKQCRSRLEMEITLLSH